MDLKGNITVSKFWYVETYPIDFHTRVRVIWWHLYKFVSDSSEIVMLSEHIFFVTERITDILNLEVENEVKFSDDVRKGILELHTELSRVVDYLRHIETALVCDEQVLSENDQIRFYPELSSIADSSHKILDQVISNEIVASDIDNLIKRIHNSYQLLLSQPTYNFITRDNINIGGNQRIGPINVSIDGPSKPPKMRRVSRPKSYGNVPDVVDIVGFSDEIETLLNQLTQDDETRVVGIVGMGGSGKTTLAKHIYHHPKIKTKFSRQVWVCISQLWDKASLLNAIWRQAAKDPDATKMDYDQLVDRLSQLLSSKSYLVILDDIWCIDAWYDISPALPAGSGSKVVVTTRNKGVPHGIGLTDVIVETKPLKDEESHELFRRRTFRANENIPNGLLQLGEKMVRKCKGLPLAITALAGILRMNKNQTTWKRISERLTHNILKMADASTQGVVKEVLALSFYELPHHLKPCVLYLRIFPEDYVVEAEKLIKMWIAECFIRTEEDEVSEAEEYLDEIIQRYIVEDVKTNYKGQVKTFQVHDLIRQLCIDIDRERSFLRDCHRLSPSITIYDSDQKSRFSCMPESQRIEYFQRILGPETSSHVRSVVFLLYLDLSKAELQPLFVKFTLLRVVVLCCLSVSGTVMPEEIGNLIHLRYLELKGDIRVFPGSIGNLTNLWTLDMRYTKWKCEAEKNLCRMKELRHLYLPHVYNWKQKSTSGELSSFERLKKLKTLWNARGGEWMLSGMPELSAALEELCLVDIMSEKQLEAVFRTPCITSNNLETLELGWCADSGDVKLRNMNILSKCKSLNKLILFGPIQVGVPVMFPPNLIKLEMELTCVEEREVMNIISKSCPYLKILGFGNKSYVGTELVCNANCFPQLEELTLELLDNLKLWTIETGAMSSLRHLTIRYCSRLDFNQQGWIFVSNIPQLKYFNVLPFPTIFEQNLPLYRKDWSRSES